MPFNIANALRIELPDPIGVDQVKQRNAFAQQDQQMRVQQNALAQDQFNYNRQRNETADSQAAHDRATQKALAYAQNLASVKGDPAQFQALAQHAASDPDIQSLGIDISHITPEAVDGLLARARGDAGVAPPTPFDQTPEYQKVNLEATLRAKQAETEHGFKIDDMGIEHKNRIGEIDAQNRATSANVKPQLVTVTNPDGTTQQKWVTPGQADGVMVDSPKRPTANEKPTEGDKKNRVLIGGMIAAEKDIRNLQGKTDPSSRLNAVAGAIPFTGGTLSSQEFRNYQAAAMRWAANYLYAKSGAQAGANEVAATAKQFFPQPGEGPEIAKTKQAAREAEMANMGGVYDMKIPGFAPPAPARSGAIQRTAAPPNVQALLDKYK